MILSCLDFNIQTLDKYLKGEMNIQDYSLAQATELEFGPL
jgi:hypothetical protein